MGGNRAEHIIEIAAPIETVFAAITDYETMAEWQSAVIECEVLEPAKGKIGELVEYKVNAMIKQIRYVLRYSYEQPSKVTWEFVEGDIKSVEGEYIFEEIDEDTTRAHYWLEIDPGMFVPGPIRKTLSDRAMLQSLKELKARAESIA